MIRPRYLKKGDIIGITAPAGAFSENEIDSAVELIKSWGLKVVFGKHLFKKYNSFAGTDKQRAEDMQRMLDSSEISAIFCARGGYGTIRIMNRISFDKFIKNPKWVIGFSDITVLHSALQQCFGVESIHGPILRSISPAVPDIVSFDSLRAFLFGELSSYDFQPNKLNLTGKAKGILTGGNLSILCSITGTRFETDTKSKILFIEDVNEYLYHIDRTIMNLETRGILKNLSALIVGDMTNMKASPSGFKKPAYDIIHDAVKKYGYPVMFGFPAGHDQHNIPLPLGRKVTLDVTAEGCSLNFKG